MSSWLLLLTWPSGIVGGWFVFGCVEGGGGGKRREEEEEEREVEEEVKEENMELEEEKNTKKEALFNIRIQKRIYRVSQSFQTCLFSHYCKMDFCGHCLNIFFATP